VARPTGVSRAVSGKATDGAPGSLTYGAGMQIPTHERLRALERRQEQLELTLRHCEAAAGTSHGPDPSLGRVLDDTSAVLAKVRAELSKLGGADARTRAARQ
jgi:hypothetical protein